MKFTLSWLKDHLETNADVQTIAAKLTAIGLEVESVEDRGAALREFTVAHVVSAEKHPNADKLKLCMVDTGSDIVQVVCGAPNARTGMKAVFAKPGVTMPGTTDVLKVGTIRGVESRGMLCSEKELQISDEHDGIIELAPCAEIGALAADALGLNDPVIDVSITPNRGDATSVYGIARDLAAAGLGSLKNGSVEQIKGQFPSPRAVALKFADSEVKACTMFSGRYIRGVKNGPSPQWVQDRLRAVGLRPISALVDVTNLISLDRGRPLHVFDADKLTGNICARMARVGEELLALDGKTYTLDSTMCVIADEKAAQGIAGIMGGELSSCTNETVNVFVESAMFDAKSIAATGRKLGIISDARYRFERGVDPAFVVSGIELATKLILEFCGGEPSDVVVTGELPPLNKAIAFTPAAVKRLAGLEVDRPEIVRILESLGFTVEGGEPMQVTAPSWRHDVDGPADLVEEVVRIHGLEHVPSVPMTRTHAIARPTLTPGQKRARIARRTLASRGFNETINFSFISRAHAALFSGGDDMRQVANPIASDLDAMRPSVLPSLLAAAARNQARGVSEAMLFEMGATFQSGMPGDQALCASAIRMGAAARHWSKAEHGADAFDAKADMLAVLETAMGAPMTAPIRAEAPSWYHPGRSGTLALGTKVLGQFGELHPAVLAAFDLKGPVCGFEVFMDAIPEPKSKGKARAVFAPSAFQPVERDFAFLLDRDVSAEDVLKAARSVDRTLIDSISVFDLYEGKGVPEGKKSLAIAVRLQPKDKTLTDAEIDAIAAKIVGAVTKATGGTLRS